MQIGALFVQDFDWGVRSAAAWQVCAAPALRRSSLVVESTTGVPAKDSGIDSARKDQGDDLRRELVYFDEEL